MSLRRRSPPQRRRAAGAERRDLPRAAAGERAPRAGHAVSTFLDLDLGLGPRVPGTHLELHRLGHGGAPAGDHAAGGAALVPE